MKIQNSLLAVFTVITTMTFSTGCNEKKHHNTPVLKDSVFAYTSLGLALCNGGKSINYDVQNLLEDSCTRFGIDSSKPVIILRYSRYSCEPCVEFAATEFERFVSKNGFKQYLTIVSDFQEKELPQKQHLINLRKKDLGIPMEKSDIPYICIVNEGVINSMIMPDREYHKYLDFYFKSIKSLSLIE